MACYHEILCSRQKGWRVRHIGIVERTDRHGTALSFRETASRLSNSLSHERNERLMTEKSKLSEGVGFALGLGGLILAGLVVCAIIEVVKHDTAIMSVGGTASGVVLGGLAGAGIGRIATQLGKCYRNKGVIGPLSLAAYVRDIAGLHAKYLGITENKAENPRECLDTSRRRRNAALRPTFCRSAVD